MRFLNPVIYYLIIVPISLLPFSVLYVFSNFLFILMYSVFGYRITVVRKNLRNAFPYKSKEELKAIEIQFYRHFCDLIVEILKSFTISNKAILKRMVVENPEVINQFHDDGRSVLIAGGHYNNWEWIAITLEQQIKHLGVAIYKPLKNKFFDKKMLSSRGKFGLRMISYKEIRKYYADHADQLTATLFAIDQSPRSSTKCYWTTFLNQDTDVQYGIEKFAHALDYPVVFGAISKIKRGYYSIRFSVLCEKPRETPYGHIIEVTTRCLEDQIIQNPPYWLWTHRRWKRKPPPTHQ